jgi:glycosyltransferase involved in cell wall biosynthesis
MPDISSVTSGHPSWRCSSGGPIAESSAARRADDALVPLVSIVIPTFNRARQISEAVLSCRRQTHPNCEIIVVDDGSSDDTPAVVAALARETGHELRLILQANAGASSARNAGLAACRGSYAQFR